MAKQQMAAGTAKITFSIPTLACPNAGIIEKKLRKIEGIRDVYVNCVANKILVNFDPSKLNSELIREFVMKLG